MGRRKRRRRKLTNTPPGSPPGTLAPHPSARPSVMRVMAYGPEHFLEANGCTLERLQALRGPWPVVWVNIDGLADAGLIARIGEMFHLHELALEDAVNLHQRAKVELYDAHLFIVARMISRRQQLETEQVSLFLGDGFVLSLQEELPGDTFDPVRGRIRKASSPVRRRGADYLAYELLDSVIDGYFPLLEELGEQLELLEDAILERPGRGAMGRLHDLKRDLLVIRRAAWPLREAMNSLVRDENRFVGDETRLHLRDCYDHTVRIIDFTETDRELASDLMDLYLSSMNQRMTEVMKVLTIIATVFIPLTFISSIYGMNFNTGKSRWNMPELEWAFGYPFALGLMGVTALLLVVYFWAKGWISIFGREWKVNAEARRHGEKTPGARDGEKERNG